LFYNSVQKFFLSLPPAGVANCPIYYILSKSPQFRWRPVVRKKDEISWSTRRRFLPWLRVHG